MGLRSVLGPPLANVVKQIADALGESGTFSHRGAAAVTLKFNLLDERIATVEQNGILSELRVMGTEIPAQTGFVAATGEAEPVTPGDILTYLGREWAALDPIIRDPVANVYTVRFSERKPIAQS